jgi:hypothetical protein
MFCTGPITATKAVQKSLLPAKQNECNAPTKEGLWAQQVFSLYHLLLSVLSPPLTIEKKEG